MSKPKLMKFQEFACVLLLELQHIFPQMKWEVGGRLVLSSSPGIYLFLDILGNSQDF